MISDLHSGANLLAMILFSHRDRFRDKDNLTLGEILAQLKMPYNMAPSTFFVNCQKLRKTMPEPFPEVNYAALGLMVQPADHGEPACFTIAKGDPPVCINMMQFELLIATTKPSQVLTPQSCKK